MTVLVLDCSVTMSWCIKSEASPDTDRLLNQVSEEGAWVPDLWHLEVTNVLLIAVKRNRIASKDVRKRFELLKQLPIRTDNQTPAIAFTAIHDLATETGLTAYDAAYLELAERKNLPLATKDKALIRAANHREIAVI